MILSYLEFAFWDMNQFLRNFPVKIKLYSNTKYIVAPIFFFNVD